MFLQSTFAAENCSNVLHQRYGHVSNIFYSEQLWLYKFNSKWLREIAQI